MRECRSKKVFWSGDVAPLRVGRQSGDSRENFRQIFALPATFSNFSTSSRTASQNKLERLYTVYVRLAGKAKSLPTVW